LFIFQLDLHLSLVQNVDLQAPTQVSVGSRRTKARGRIEERTGNWFFISGLHSW